MSAKRARLVRAEYAACSARWSLCDIFMDPPDAPTWLVKWRSSHDVPRERGQRYRCFARFIRRHEVQRSNNWSRFAPVEPMEW